MADLKITAGPYVFEARFEHERAPKTVAAFKKHLTFSSKIIHVRWSGEGVWVPLGDLDFGVGYENNTCYPRRARSSSIRAVCQKPKSCSPMAM